MVLLEEGDIISLVEPLQCKDELGRTYDIYVAATEKGKKLKERYTICESIDGRYE